MKKETHKKHLANFQETMNLIIEKYYLEPKSSLVFAREGTKGVDCWFDTDTVRQHRCLSFEDYLTIN